MLDNKLVQITLSVLMISVAALCLYTPDIFIVKRGADFTVQIMFGFLWLGMLFLLLDKSKLMFTSLASCGVLCLYLISMTNQSMRFVPGAKLFINRMVDGLHVRMEVEDSGMVIYEFPEIISRFENE